VGDLWGVHIAGYASGLSGRGQSHATRELARSVTVKEKDTSTSSYCTNYPRTVRSISKGNLEKKKRGKERDLNRRVDCKCADCASFLPVGILID